MSSLQVMPCDMLLPPTLFNKDWTSKRLCHQSFYNLPPAAICVGDSGGPLVVCDGNRIVVIGVTSYFYQKMKRCEKEESVSAYLDVQAYLTWIQNVISPGEN